MNLVIILIFTKSLPYLLLTSFFLGVVKVYFPIRFKIECLWLLASTFKLLVDKPIKHKWFMNMCTNTQFKFNALWSLVLTWYVPRTTYFFAYIEKFNCKAIRIHKTISLDWWLPYVIPWRDEIVSTYVMVISSFWLKHVRIFRNYWVT